jgi:hypothetical protein
MIDVIGEQYDKISQAFSLSKISPAYVKPDTRCQINFRKRAYCTTKSTIRICTLWTSEKNYLGYS